jgi:hypothetical protein
MPLSPISCQDSSPLQTVPQQPEAGERHSGQPVTGPEQLVAAVIAQLPENSTLESDLQKRKIVIKKRMTPFF